MTLMQLTSVVQRSATHEKITKLILYKLLLFIRRDRRENAKKKLN